MKAIVIGASSGIGRELAKILSGNGYTVGVMARRAHLLNELRKEIQGEFLLFLGGLASVLFGLILMVRPGVGALAVIWLIGVYAVVFGIILVGLAFRARSFAKKLAAS